MSEEFFFSLTPDVVLRSVEESGLICTGRCMALNSYENRVYDVEIENEDGVRERRIAKFYRPGRWTREQLLEEHGFIADLVDSEIPAVAPLPFADGSTLRQTAEGIFYTIFPRVGGRSPEELSSEQLVRLGRLLGRMHAVGASKPAPHRISLTPTTYGLKNLEFLLEGGWLPLEIRSRYEKAVRSLCTWLEPRYAGLKLHRLHGDCHLGNLLWNDRGPFFLDFDDMVNGPAVQDLWLILPGRPTQDDEARAQLEALLEGYEDFRVFDRTQISLIEGLRGLRFVHYAAWIARRWKDPAFPAAFPQFNTSRYWDEQLRDLEKQVEILTETRAALILE
jgi:Ser/Thr protein kinase RdoA (MazF antagonist)